MSGLGQAKGDVLVMRKPVAVAGGQVREVRQVREATTGRFVSMKPRPWAVSENGLLRRVEGSASALGERVDASQDPDPKPRTGRTAIVPEGEVAFYRKYTEALLRRYQRLRLGTGRVPSPMDREMFRGRMSVYRVRGFDDAVIFCADVERCLGRLNAEDQQLLRRITVQEYTLGEAAGLLRMSLRRCVVLYRRALDRSTRLLLADRLLEPLAGLAQEPAEWLSRGAGRLP